MKSPCFAIDSIFETHHQPSERNQTTFVNSLDVYHTSPDFGERHYKSSSPKRPFGPWQTWLRTMAHAGWTKSVSPMILRATRWHMLVSVCEQGTRQNVVATEQLSH